MGSGIATALILANYEVILKEVNDKFLQAGVDRVKCKTCPHLVFHCQLCRAKHTSILTRTFLYSANLKSRVKKGQMSQEKFEKTISFLKGSLDYESFRDVDMVIEVF